MGSYPHEKEGEERLEREKEAGSPYPAGRRNRKRSMGRKKGITNFSALYCGWRGEGKGGGLVKRAGIRASGVITRPA